MAFESKIKLTGDAVSVNSTIAGVQKKIAGIRSNMGSSIGGALGGMFAVGTITAGIKNLLDFSGNVQDTADGLGLTVKRTLELEEAAMLAGKSVEDIGKGLKTVEKAAVAALSGNETAMASFKALGVSENQLKTSNKDELLKAVLSGAQGMDRSQAEMLLGNVLGKGAGSLLGMSEGIINGNPAADKEAQAVEALAEVGDQLDLFTRRLKLGLLPILVSVGEKAMSLWTKTSNGIAKYAGAAMAFASNIGTGKAFESAKAAMSLADTEDAQAAAEADVEKQKRADARAAKNASLAGKVKRTGNVGKDKDKKEKDVADKMLLDSNLSGGSSQLGMGGLIGVNSAYRLERLSNETNKWLSSIDQTLKAIKDNAPKSNDLSYLQQGE